MKVKNQPSSFSLVTQELLLQIKFGRDITRLAENLAKAEGELEKKTTEYKQLEEKKVSLEMKTAEAEELREGKVVQ